MVLFFLVYVSDWGCAPREHIYYLVPFLSLNGSHQPPHPPERATFQPCSVMQKSRSSRLFTLCWADGFLFIQITSVRFAWINTQITEVDFYSNKEIGSGSFSKELELEKCHIYLLE